MRDNLFKVLLVEDNPGDVRLIGEMLAEVKGARFELQYAGRLSTGLERLAAGGIDVVLLDLSLPDSQGLDTFARVQAQAPQVPVIVLTGLDDEALAIKAVREGAQDYLVKGQVDSHLLGRAIRYALERARLYQETVRRLKETETLNAVTTTLTRSLDLDQVLQAIVDSATGLVSASTGSVIHLVDEATGRLIPRASAAPEVGIQEALEMSIGQGIAGLVLQEKRLINVSNVEEDPRFLRVDIPTPKKSLLSAPLMMGDRCLGTISLHSNKVNAFTPEDERLLSTLASQAAIAVENARLYEKVTERMIEATLLHRLSDVLIRTLNLDQLLENILDVLHKAFGYSHCAILLPDKKSGELRVKAARGYLQAMKEAFQADPAAGITGWVATHKVPLNVPDVTRDERYVEWVEETRSEIAVPMLGGEQVVGILDIQSPKVHAFSEDDLRILSSVAAQAAIAIERARLFQEVRELDRMKSDFVSNVSHELRTPLANIKLYAALAQKGRPEKRQHYLDIIESETERLETLIEDILDLSRLERGAVKLQMEPLPLAEIVQQVVGAHLATAQAKGIELAWQVPDGLPTLYADRTQLLLMLNNLLGNALQYTPRGGSVWVEARVGKWRGQPALHIAVHDTGIGIPPDEQERIFERFYRGRHTPVGTTGTGLGLAIVKESMALHGGDVTVESAVGQGSTFTLCFPLRRAAGGKPRRSESGTVA